MISEESSPLIDCYIFNHILTTGQYYIKYVMKTDILAAVIMLLIEIISSLILVKLKNNNRISSDTITLTISTISEATSIWINLKEYFESPGMNGLIILKCFLERYKVAITPYHIPTKLCIRSALPRPKVN